jgi:hypothetical protein
MPYFSWVWIKRKAIHHGGLLMAGTGLKLLSPAEQAAKEDAWTAQVRSSPEFILAEEQKRQTEQKVREQQTSDLMSALSKQTGRRKKGGTLLTDPTSFMGGSGLGQSFGAKKVLGE